MRVDNIFKAFAVLLLVQQQIAVAAEVQSPERFLKEHYGWTIGKLDDERGVFGQYKNFNCFDDRLGPPKAGEDGSTRRMGAECQTKRFSNENLGAMIFVSWANPAHPKPITIQQVFDVAARQMAGAQRDEGFQAKCGSPEVIDKSGKALSVYDCAMVLPFGTFFASFLHFQHRGTDFYIRIQYAANTPFPNEPKETARKIAGALVFE